MDTFVPRSLYPWGKSPRYPVNWRLGESRFLACGVFFFYPEDGGDTFLLNLG
jgi:hypothetical protein